MTHQHVRIAVTQAAEGGVENVPARRIGRGLWQLMRSPLYAMEAASGDVVRILDEHTGEFEIETRGGNVCVQLYLSEQDADDAEATVQLAERLAKQIDHLRGRMDGFTPGLITFTLPVDIGLPTIEALFEEAVGHNPGAQWQYANVYDSVTGEPLGWWEQFPK